jgi:hypothetical protein
MMTEDCEGTVCDVLGFETRDEAKNAVVSVGTTTTDVASVGLASLATQAESGAKIGQRLATGLNVASKVTAVANSDNPGIEATAQTLGGLAGAGATVVTAETGAAAPIIGGVVDLAVTEGTRAVLTDGPDQLTNAEFVPQSGDLDFSSPGKFVDSVRKAFFTFSKSDLKRK